ncbi:hypothetical protein IPH25_00910 [bacterium]|nr:MAG: hypothetical protein IPG37_03030 [bacterium]QQR61986.1 MAG: hypothetical protein IPH25_00910 [bacterium]QQR62421.1 MAG: hypothetical protein IPH67_03250 [bacterium]
MKKTRIFTILLFLQLFSIPFFALIEYKKPYNCYSGWIFLFQRGQNFYEKKVPADQKATFISFLESYDIDKKAINAALEVSNEQVFYDLSEVEKYELIQTGLTIASAMIAWRKTHECPYLVSAAGGCDKAFAWKYPEAFALYTQLELNVTSGKNLVKQFNSNEKLILFTTEQLKSHFKKDLEVAGLTDENFCIPDYKSRK